MEVLSVSWWLAGAVITAAIVTGAALERVVLRRLAGDHRPADVQQRSRRSARWLSALAAVALAQVAIVAVSLAGIGWSATPARPVAWGAAAGLVLVLVLVAVLAGGVAVTRRARRRVTSADPVRPLAPAPLAPALLAAALLAPALVAAAAQEVLFRGALLGWLLVAADGSAAGRLAAVAATAVGFGLSRLPRGRAATVAAALTGLVLGLAVVATGWVVVAVLAHVTLLLLVAAGQTIGRTVSQPGGPTSTSTAVHGHAQDTGHRSSADGAGDGCAGHDPQSPGCAGCPMRALTTPPETAAANA